MIQPKNLAVAFAFMGLLTISGIANADGKLYVEVGASMVQPGDASAEFTTQRTGASWDLGDMQGGKLEIGGDFGQFRAGVKIRVLEGDVDAISGVTAVSSVTGGEGPDTVLGVATFNLYWDIADIEAGDKASITPYVGVGAGHAQGFMQAEGTLAGVLREDHRNDGGTALSGSVGALFSINENVGVTAEYEYLDVDFGGLDVHSASLGLRLSF